MSLVEVSSEISGKLTEVNVDFGSRVKRDQVLALVDPSTYKQRLLQAQADFAAAKANHHFATANTQRLRDLRSQDLVTEQEYDQALALLEQSHATLLTREATVSNAQLDLGRCTIKSPIEGLVLHKQAEVGKTVVSSFSAPTLFVIAQDLAKLRIDAPISEVDVQLLRPGQAVTFTVDAIPDRVFSGQLLQIRSPYTPSEKQQQQVAPQNSIVSFEAMIEVDNSDLRLRPSLTALVSISIEERVGVLRIPNGALRVELPKGQSVGRTLSIESSPSDVEAEGRTGQPASAVVYRLPTNDGSASPQAVRVQLGVSGETDTEIVSGLKEGDYIITAVSG